MLGYLIQYWKELVWLVYEMAPWLLLGFAIAGILHVFLREEKITKFLGKSSMRHVFRAAIFGIPLPLCSCGVIPTGISIYRGGASKGASIAFLISTPQTGADSVMVTYSLLGLPFAILRPIVALITGVLGGIITNLWDRDQSGPDESAEGSSDSCPIDRDKKPSRAAHLPWFMKIYEAGRYALVDFFGDVSRSLLLGLLIAALIAAVVPGDLFKSYIQNDFLGMLIILVVSIPLYVCATSSVPIAAVLIAKGLSPGAALVFLMAGPATNAATITMLGSVMGRRALLTYLGTIIVGALSFGLFIDYFLPGEWFVPMGGHEHVHGALLPEWLNVGASVIFVIALAYALFRQFFSKRHHLGHAKEGSLEAETVVLHVEGMSCGNCKRRIEEAMHGLEGVDEAEVDLARKTLTIRGAVDVAQVRQTIQGLGYTVVGR